jgi:excisionase family DNA binding protein
LEKEGGMNQLRRADVARMLGVAPNTVTRWAREGRLPSQVTLGGHHRFDARAIQEIQGRLVRGPLMGEIRSEEIGEDVES